MRWLGGLAAMAVAAGLSLAATAQPAAAATGITVSGTRILEGNGNPFVMRGVNHAHTWYADRFSSLADIKAQGANTVRVVLSTGDRWTRNDATDVARVVAECKRLRLICVLEAHDTTGYGEDAAATTLARAVDYWIGIKSALDGQENYVILNIGNEPYGNTNATGWIADTKNAIARLRAAGFAHALMVDAPNWGQDWQFIMRDNAASVLASDPQHNTIFSIHMYGVFDTAAEITDYIGRFQTAGLPLVIGEFGHNHSDGNPDEDTILATAQARGIGYLGWSWSGNGGGVEYLDMVTGFNPAQLTSWGDRLFNGANGIKATAREATIYGGTTPTTPTTPTPTTPTPTTPTPTTPTPTTPTPTTPVLTTPAPSGGCTATYAVSGSWGTGFQGAVTVTAGRTAIRGWTVTWTWPSGQQLTNTWNATITTTGSTVTARNMPYNGSLAAGATASWGFTASYSGTNTAPTVTCTAA
ncbi:cellulase family glycosylhydrolase [Actinoplanes sp. URMC 104]|uniref:cellulase family glycosylhydrolase n=1 Tax=Actinoplanes sp. URMC 104 TaxID=3423409 RepID=UPI003F1B198C